MKKILQPYIYGVIKDECQRVEESHIAPVVATERAIFDRVKADVQKAIDELDADGLINKSINVNHMAMYRPIIIEDEK